MNPMTENNQRKWYLEPYVWLLIALPLSAVIGGMITLRYAIVSNDGLVVDDYYKRGLEINRTLDRDHAAVKHGLKSTLQLNPETGQARIILESKSTYSLPDSLDVSFLYSTRAGHDIQTRLKRVAGNIYDGTIPKLIRGHWYIQIEADDWRLLESKTVY